MTTQYSLMGPSIFNSLKNQKEEYWEDGRREKGGAGRIWSEKAFFFLIFFLKFIYNLKNKYDTSMHGN